MTTDASNPIGKALADRAQAVPDWMKDTKRRIDLERVAELEAALATEQERREVIEDAASAFIDAFEGIRENGQQNWPRLSIHAWATYRAMRELVRIPDELPATEETE